jgi:hypothetical protein
MGVGVGGGLGPIRGGISTRGVGGRVGPVSAGYGYRRRSSSSSAWGIFWVIAGVIFLGWLALLLVLLSVAWPVIGVAAIQSAAEHGKQPGVRSFVIAMLLEAAWLVLVARWLLRRYRSRRIDRIAASIEAAS